MRRSHLFVSLLALNALAIPRAALADADSRGSDFWLMFPTNYTTPPELSLFVTGETATSGVVSVPGLGFSQSFTTSPGTVTTVTLPSAAQTTTADGVEARGIHVTAGDEVTVYGLSRYTATTDAYLGLPTDILGTEYVVMAYPNVYLNGTEFGVAATEDDTTVTITPSVTTGARPAGVAYQIVLDAGEVYELRNTAAGADLSGTVITSSAAVAVWGGHLCANVPDGQTYACDHIVEQLPPTNTWGRNFVTVPLATRLRGDTFRFVAQTDGTEVRVNGTLVDTLNRGEVHQRIIAGASEIVATEPILLTQLSNGSTYDNVTSDPFLMVIPPQEQFLPAYTLTTPASGFSVNYINLVVPAAGIDGITLDGSLLPASSFTAIAASGYYGAQVPVGLGSHRLEGDVRFGAFSYGFDSYDSYGYPGGMSLARVAEVTTLDLEPETATNPVGTNDCVTATVLDQDSNPVEGITVDFEVAGANSGFGFANTAADGTATFCYTGVNEGVDTIDAAVGSITDSATKTWIPEDTHNPPSCALTGVVAGPPKQLQIVVQDADDGIASIEVTQDNNASVEVPAFDSGEKDALMIVATKIDEDSSSQVALRITDVSGDVTECDPIVPGAEDPAMASSHSSEGDVGGGCSMGQPVGGSAGFAGFLGALLGLALVRRRRMRA